ncbi:MAG: cupin domain-containing protein [Phototrophicaceae bacterium]
MLTVQPIARQEWVALPNDGCHNVYAQILIKEPSPALVILKFEPHGTIHEHPADHDIDVVCLEGEGMVKVGDDVAPIKAGERVRWHSGIPHQLWTMDSTMKTLMIERYPEN